jgi:hypothetical protein
MDRWVAERVIGRSSGIGDIMVFLLLLSVLTLVFVTLTVKAQASLRGTCTRVTAPPTPAWKKEAGFT